MSVPGLTFCIGGPYGHSEAVRARADDTVRLSSLVLNHQVSEAIGGRSCGHSFAHLFADRPGETLREPYVIAHEAADAE